jgi:hypothetical protein
MSKVSFRSPFHQTVQQLLGMLDDKFLVAACCYFGGGTRIVLDLDEYRESRDIDFLCASHDGYRLLRESVTESSLGPIAAKPLKLAREVRSDQYGIRTFIESSDGTKVKFEIVREGRIALGTSPGPAIAGVRVPVLSRVDAFAEKFLANADRGLDVATSSRDIVDLAFMIQGWEGEAAIQGWALAEGAYGSTIDKALNAVAAKMKSDVVYRKKCFETLRVTETKRCVAGIELLASSKWRRVRS